MAQGQGRGNRVGKNAGAVTGAGAPAAPGRSPSTFAVFASGAVRVGPESVITGGNVGAAGGSSHAIAVLAGEEIDQAIFGEAVLLSNAASIGDVQIVS